MRKFLLIILVSALAGGATYAAERAVNADGMSAAEQERFEKQLAGRVPGAPLACVSTRDLAGGNDGYGDGVIVFKGRMSKDPLYVNRPAGGCANFDRSSALRFRIPSTRLCRGDLVEVFDPQSRVTYGSCGLGDFVPYKRAG